MVLVFLKLAGRMWRPLNSGADVGLLDPGGGLPRLNCCCSCGLAPRNSEATQKIKRSAYDVGTAEINVG